MPLDHDDAGAKPAAPRALVRIIDRDHEKQSGTALLRQLYNFTSTEFEIAVRLARGEDLKQISDELTSRYGQFASTYTTSSTKPTPTAKPNWSHTCSP
jgi:hypothetical protein